VSINRLADGGGFKHGRKPLLVKMLATGLRGGETRIKEKGVSSEMHVRVGEQKKEKRRFSSIRRDKEEEEDGKRYVLIREGRKA